MPKRAEIYVVSLVFFIIGCKKEEIDRGYVIADTFPLGIWESENVYYNITTDGTISINLFNDKSITSFREGIYIRNMPLLFDTISLKNEYEENFDGDIHTTSHLVISSDNGIIGGYYTMSKDSWLVLNQIEPKTIHGEFQIQFKLDVGNENFPDTIKLFNGIFTANLNN